MTKTGGVVGLIKLAARIHRDDSMIRMPRRSKPWILLRTKSKTHKHMNVTHAQGSVEQTQTPARS
nr:hypothetical protein BCU62_13225 [Enterovibrio norvegicus]